MSLWVVEQNQVTGIDKKTSRTLTRDEEFNFRAAHWADLHGLLLDSLPSEIFLWGHQFLSFCISDDKNSVTLKVKVLKTSEIIQVVGDLLIAADGCLSSIRKTFLPNHSLRFLFTHYIILTFSTLVLLHHLQITVRTAVMRFM